MAIVILPSRVGVIRSAPHGTATFVVPNPRKPPTLRTANLTSPVSGLMRSSSTSPTSWFWKFFTLVDLISDVASRVDVACCVVIEVLLFVLKGVRGSSVPGAGNFGCLSQLRSHEAGMLHYFPRTQSGFRR